MIDPRPLWDFDDPDSSGERFLDAAEHADEPERTAWLTQYVRALGLQEKYDEANRILDTLSSDDPEAATYMGIDVNRAHRTAFGIGTAIAGVAGGLIVLSHPVQPFVGTDFVVIMYAGVVMGGMGSVIGAFWGGMVIGLVQQASTLVLPLQLQNAVVFAAFVLILLFRPQGLFGRSVERA